MSEKKHLKVIVGSKNPVKINAAHNALQRLFPDNQIESEGMHAPSGVPDQPMNSAETRQGAINRALYCRQHREADFYMAMEGGVDLFEDGPATFAYVVIADKNQQSVGCSARLPLPKQIYDALVAGEELGHIMDRLFNTENVKQKGGAIGLLTHNQASRESNYTEALILALAPFINRDLFA